MFFKTDSESSDLAKFLGFDLIELRSRDEDIRRQGSVRVAFEGRPNATFAIARRMVSWLGDFRSCLFWVTERCIWPSSENWHLYYRLRASYGDLRQIHEAPGHVFMYYEVPDLISFVDLAIQFGWGGHLLTDANFPSVFISHDGWARVQRPGSAAQVMRDVEELQLGCEQD